MSRQSFSQRCKPIDRLFIEIIDHNVPHEQCNREIIVQLVKDTSDKFKLWEKSAGLLQPASESLLEAYLANAPRLKEELHNLLESLEETLRDASSIAAGLREDRMIIKERHGQADQEHSLKATTTTELKDLMGITSDTVGTLLRFLLLVDKAATRDYDVHALKSQRGMSQGAFDTDYVRMYYPKLDQTENKCLLERLARAVTARREFLSWSKRHKQQLEKHRRDAPGLPEGRESSVIHMPASTSSTDASAGQHKTQSRQLVEPEPFSTSRFNFDALVRESSEPPSATDIDITSSDSSFNIHRLHLPSLNDVKKNSETGRVCPLCLEVISLATEESWQNHAHYDLKSYVCTSGDQCDSRLFGNQSAWIDHELRFHRCQWICFICQQGPFMEPEDFSDHLVQGHAELELPDEALEALKNASQCAVEVMPATSCPLCDDWGLMLEESGVAKKRGKSSSGAIQKQNIDVPTIDFLRHIATHLEQLAISAISENILDLAEINNGSGLVELIKSGADVSAVYKNGKTPLHLAQSPLMAKELIKRGADVLAVDKDGKTPLHLTQSASVAKVLLESGADPSAVDNDGKTPLFYAQKSSYTAIADVVIEFGGH